MDQRPSNAVNGDGSAERLPIVRELPGNQKIKRLRVLKHGCVPTTLALEEIGKGRWRDQNKHLWTIEENTLVAAH